MVLATVTCAVAMLENHAKPLHYIENVHVFSSCVCHMHDVNYVLMVLYDSCTSRTNKCNQNHDTVQICSQ